MQHILMYDNGNLWELHSAFMSLTGMNSLSLTSFQKNHAELQGLSTALSADRRPAGKEEQYTSTYSLADFQQQAGVRHKDNQHARRSSLHERLVLARRSPLRNRQVHPGAEHEDEELQVQASAFLQRLQRGEGRDVYQSLEQRYDPLELYSLLGETLRQTEELGDPQERLVLQSELKAFLSESKAKQGESLLAADAMRAQFQSALGKVLAAGNEASSQNTSLSSLRSQLGWRNHEKDSAALSPLALATTLKDKFGDTFFMQGLGGLRSAMAKGMRGDAAIDQGPQLWLSMNDSKSFNVVQTCYAAAGNLRQDVSVQLQLTSRASQVGTMLALLDLFDNKRVKASEFGNFLVDFTKLNAQKKMRLFMLLERTIASFPLIFWQSESYAKRLAMLEEFRNAAVLAANELDEQHTAADKTEQYLRVTRKQQQQSHHQQQKQEQGQEQRQEQEQDELDGA